MKKAILSIGIFCLAIISNAQTPGQPALNLASKNGPHMQFETEVMDYGTIEHNASGEREFKFKNTGKEPLIISNAVGSCGCTTPQWPKDPIKPGESAVIKVKYDTNRIGKFEKTVTLTSNADESSKILKIKGEVLPDKTPAAPATPEKK